MSEELCKHCGGPIAIRNPRGDCDHLYWPEMLTDEAKIANGFSKVLVEVWRKETPQPDPLDEQKNRSRGW